MELIFEWNREKERINFLKHGVSFEEAKTVFFDPLAKIFDDKSHSFKENREIIIGHSKKIDYLLWSLLKEYKIQ